MVKIEVEVDQEILDEVEADWWVSGLMLEMKDKKFVLKRSY